MFVVGEVCVEGIVDRDGGVVILPRIEWGIGVVAYVAVAIVVASASAIAFSADAYADAIDAASTRLVDVVASVASADAPVDAHDVDALAVEWEDGPPLPPRIEDRSSLAKLELRVERCPPSKPVAPADLSGSWAC